MAPSVVIMLLIFLILSCNNYIVSKKNCLIYVEYFIQMLRAECAQEISGQVKESAKNIHLDPYVMKECQAEVR